MVGFWAVLTDPGMPFLRYAVIAGLLGGIAFGMVGTVVVTRNLVAIGGAIAHAALAGIGAACYCQQSFQWQWCTPLLGATAAAMLAAWLVGLASLYARQREDTVIGAIWAIGMAIGMLFLARTPGYVDLQSYLFGNILLIGTRDLYWLVVLDFVVIAGFVLFFRWILAVIFDRDFAALRGVRSNLVFLGLLQLIALTVVLLVNIVGVFMVIALLALPAATAGELSRRLPGMMALAIAFSALFSLGGIWISYSWELPTGPVIVVLAGILYLAVLAARYLWSRRSPGNATANTPPFRENAY